MQKLTKLTIILLIIAAGSLTLAILKVSNVILKPEATEAMKGSESVGGRYLKEESFWERYGVSPEGLVLWLSQSDVRSYGDSANWYDISGKGNHGTQTTADYQPAIVSGSGLAGFARSFDGSNDYVNYGDITIFDNLSKMSFSIWFAPNFIQSTAFNGVLFDKNLAPRVMFVDGLDDFNFQINTSGGLHAVETTGITFSANSWHNLAGTYDGSVLKVYWDGIFENQTTGLSGTINNVAQIFVIGALYNYVLPWDGLISDVRIYNRALTAAEIQKLYLADKPRYGGL